jgi:anaerobic selenocysteine-containing dehydrogenase
MTFKRHIDRLPIIPADAKEHNVVCQFCIVGCGYHAYTWPINEQGGTSPSDNKFGVDLSKQQLPMTPNWYSPSMYNIVKQDGKDVHLVIKPDPNCVVNSGLASIRGARMAEESYSEARSTQQQRLTEPMVWRYGQMQPTSWDDALDLVARVTAAVIDTQGEDGLFVSAFDHGGAGGGYENTWGTGKLYFGAMKIKNIRIHNRPAYNSEVHATRDMGVGELNNCYEDAELAPWRGLEAPGKEEESKRFAFLINNGRANHVWQSAYLDQREDLVMDRLPYPFIQINPEDMKELGLSAGDLVEVYNENGATQAMAYPTPTAKHKQTCMLFAYPMGVQGNVVSPGVNELIIPNYKQTWGDIRKISSAPGAARATSFKSWEYKV